MSGLERFAWQDGKYWGAWDGGGRVVVTRPDGSPLPPSLELANHSPTGFAWG